MTYSEKLKDPRWQKKRLEILNRDQWACRDCGEKSKTLHVHHCQYSKHGPWATPNRHLMTLCEDCHESRGSSEEFLKESFTTYVALLSPREIHDLWSLFMVIGGAEAGKNMKLLEEFKALCLRAEIFLGEELDEDTDA